LRHSKSFVGPDALGGAGFPADGSGSTGGRSSSTESRGGGADAPGFGAGVAGRFVVGRADPLADAAEAVADRAGFAAWGSLTSAGEFSVFAGAVHDFTIAMPPWTTTPTMNEAKVMIAQPLVCC
jgi:hypothetical protein